MTPRVARTDLGSAHVLLTGATGFVGQAVLERLLADHPKTTITILLRTKGSAGADDRLRMLLRKPVFRAWRERVGADKADAIAKKRIRVLEGGLSDVPPLPTDIDIAIHSAASVSFDPPVDQAFSTNVGGAVNLYEALLASGSTPDVVHVSTCYVGGLRKGVQPEASLTHTVDWRAEYRSALAAREQVETESRDPELLRGFIGAARAEHGKEGPQAVAKAAEAARVEWVTAKLVDWGRTRAESLGWTDVYTLTKAFAERAAETLWAGNGHKLSVVRPAIIESAIQHPYPGWIDGFKVADPLIVAYGRGQLPEFPGLPDSVLDLIPVDYVVNAILAAAANPPAKDPQYFHVASGNSNPLPFHEMFEYVNRFFLDNPMPKAGEGHVIVPDWKFPGGNQVEKAIVRRERRVARAARWAARLPRTAGTRDLTARLQRGASDLETLRNFVVLYRVYVQTEIIFDDTNLRALHEALPAKVQADRGFDIPSIDWKHYLLDVHFPSITDLTRMFSRGRGGGAAVTPTAAKVLPERRDVLAVFDMEGTVVDSNIVLQWLWVKTAGWKILTWPFRVVGVLARLSGYLRAEKRDRGEFIRSFLRRYEGTRVARLERIVRGGYTNTLLRHTSPQAVARIRAHRAAGHRTVLVTGSIGRLVEPLAGLFDEVVAGEMHERDGVLTGYLAKPPLVDEARAAWLRQYAERGGYDLRDSYGYGDSHADLVWLDLLGHPHAVNPDAALRAEAQRRRWPIDRWSRTGRSPKRGEIEAPTRSAAASEDIPEGVS
ncbi:MAG: HAD-IB family hydrolase [Actinomycetales bacterium]|nr:HAD-IB family hydrolase [Actinomycetales bacterium]